MNLQSYKIKKKFITPGSKVLIHTGEGKGLEKVVFVEKKGYLFLKDYLKNSFKKKTYKVRVHKSNCKLISRNYCPPPDVPK